MLPILSQKCTDVLIRHQKITKEQYSIYLYGFELLFSTGICIMSILLLGALFHYLHLAIIFLLFFIPVRIAGGGYHAKSYANCYILTNSIALGCVVISYIIWKNQTKWLNILLLITLLFSLYIMWKKAPIIPYKYRLQQERFYINRKYARCILTAESISLLYLMLLHNHCMTYTAIVTTYAVAIMMIIPNKEGGHLV